MVHMLDVERYLRMDMRLAEACPEHRNKLGRAFSKAVSWLDCAACASLLLKVATSNSAYQEVYWAAAKKLQEELRQAEARA